MRHSHLAIYALALAVFGARAANAQCDGNWGTALAAYRNVTAFSNGSGCLCCQGTYGYQYQCVEYAKRFYGEAMHFSSTGWSGDGSDYYGSAETKGLRVFDQDGAVKPKENDIICFSGGAAGHVGIITSVGAAYVDMIDQNRTTSSADNPKRLTMEVIDGTYRIHSFSGSYPVQGWLRGYTSDYDHQSPSTSIDLSPGQEYEFKVWFRNTSRPNAPHWRNDGGDHSIELRSCTSAGDEASCFLRPVAGRPAWLDPTDRKRIVRMTQSDVGTDGVAEFSFWGRVPDGATTGLRVIYFRPFHNSGEWIEEWGGMSFSVNVVAPDPPPPPPPPSAPAFTALTGRFNDDTYSDVCLYDEVPGSWYVSCRDPSANRFIANISPWLTGFGINGGYTALAGDIGGSDLDDVCLFNPALGRWFVAYSAGDHFSIATGTGPNGSWLDDWGADETNKAYTPFLADANNDGYLDAVLYEAVTGNWYVSLRNPSANDFIRAYTPWITGFGDGIGLYQPVVGNFCGDGKYDIALYALSTGNWYVAQNTGSGFTRSATNPWITGFGNGSSYQVLAGQFRGDVLTDIALFQPSTGNWFVAQSTGSAFTKLNGPEIYGAWITGYGDSAYRPLTGYFSWDSYLDIGLYDPTLGRWFVATNDGNPDRFTRTDGPYAAGSWLDGWGTEPSGKMLPPREPDTHEPLNPLPEPSVIASSFSLFPNPLPPGAVLQLVIPTGSKSVTVTDVSGRVVFTSPATLPRISWDPQDAPGTRLSSGIYFVRLSGQSSGRTTQKLIVLR